VEHHGENPRQNVIAVIPARFASTRLPGKLLLDIGGKPLILHTLAQAAKAQTVSRVVAATDDERILRTVRDAGGEAVMTSADHASGSDRLAEVAESLPSGSIVVNVQGDEPLIAPDTIDRAVEALIEDDMVDIATTCEPIDSIDELLNGNVVKVVTNERGHALYFSRSPMPYPRDASLRYDGDPNKAIREEPELMSIFRKHTGLYVYRREFLLEFTKMPQSRLEKIEMLEQLRALENGAVIKVVEAASKSIGVDTQEDLDEVRRIIAAGFARIRPAEPADVPRIARVHVESWQRSFAGLAPSDYLNSMSVGKRTRVFVERLTEPTYRLLVAENGSGEVVGFIDYGKPDFENFGYDARIYSFYLLPEFQRKGVGKRLFSKCLECLARDGFGSVCLDTLEMSPYRRFYEKEGGRIAGRDKHWLGEKEFATVIYGWDNLNK
jgi:3-deoxy-manno-octulosonate cytidylyltransferase (CMP-KDO synthetase)